MDLHFSINRQITEITKQHRIKLQRYILENVKELTQDSKENERETFTRGSFGKVIALDFRGVHCVGKELHPIIFDFGTDASQIQIILQKFFDEIVLLSRMKHSNIVRFVGIFYKQNVTLPVLVMEKMECSLHEYLSTYERGSIGEETALNILLDVSKGLVYLHKEMKVAHRDLSSNNILLTADLTAKIADHGSARVLERPGGWNPWNKLTQNPDTMDFMPPEALKEPPEYTVSTDVFSFGCLIVHINTHKWPSPTPVPKGEFVSEIARRQEYISEMLDSYLLPMVLQCLIEQSTERPTSMDVMNSLKARVEESKFLGVAMLHCTWLI